MSERRVSEVPKLDIYTKGERHEQLDFQLKVHRRGEENGPLELMREKSGDESTSDVTEAL